MTWQRTHCIECWGTPNPCMPDPCTDCPCHEADEGSDCD